MGVPMPLFLPGSAEQEQQSSESWCGRVRENLKAAVTFSRLEARVVAGAPLRFESARHSTQFGPAQTYSAAVHAALIVVALLFVTATRGRVGLPPGIQVTIPDGPLHYLAPPDLNRAQNPSLGSKGSGGEDGLLAPRKGNLAPRSSMPLAPPRIPQSREVLLAAPPAVLDPNAPADVRTETNLGLPWMKVDTQSAGQGNHHGIGVGDNGTMGDRNGNGAGEADDTEPYVNAATAPVCLYCPEPPYTEEARKAKLQGTVTMEVLVGTDGMAKRVRILKALGLGLDEQLIAGVKKWRFGAARDAQHQPVACWVTIETSFRLY